jgi:hypothetical protein
MAFSESDLTLNDKLTRTRGSGAHSQLPGQVAVSLLLNDFNPLEVSVKFTETVMHV